jgi:hypothetical protein
MVIATFYKSFRELEMRLNLNERWRDKIIYANGKV